VKKKLGRRKRLQAEIANLYLMELKKYFLKFSQIRRWFSQSDDSNLLMDHLTQAESKMDLSEKVQWSINLIRWIQRDPETCNKRTTYLLHVLENNADLKNRTVLIIVSVLSECSMFRLLLQTGSAVESGLLAELGERFIARLIPHVLSYDFLEIIDGVQAGSSETPALLANLSDSSKEALINLILNQENTELKGIFEQIAKSAKEALTVLAANSLHYGLSSSFRPRQLQFSIQNSSFLQLQLLICKFIDPGIAVDSNIQLKTQIEEALGNCRQVINKIYENLETEGVSVAVVYRLEVLSACLNRIDKIIVIMSENDFHKKIEEIFSLATEICEAARNRKSIRRHLSDQVNLIFRKIVERNGSSGDHYIARNKAEIRVLIYSAMKGGIIVAVMTLVKVYAHLLELPPLVLAFCTWIIYSTGFISMQLTGGTLATKLPSYTASHLAHKLKDIKTRDGSWEFSSELFHALKSQALALLGNVLGLTPIALLMSFCTYSVFHATIIPADEAQSLISDLHPYLSFALPLAALTGVELWLSSLAGGWFENWLVFHDVPLAIEQNRKLQRFVGFERSKYFSKKVIAHSSAFASNIALGFLFGFIPFIGQSVGIPLEGKHVSISTAGALLAVLSLDPGKLTVYLISMTIVGLACIGILNFFVSFYLALWVAARSCNIKSVWLKFVVTESIGSIFKRKNKS
jgi:site-specific recombinase